MTTSPRTMRRTIVSADHDATVQQVPVPVPATGEALVQMTSAGVCGSDTHALSGRHPFIRLPYAPGHEVIGTVRSVGEGVMKVRVGDRVTVEPTLPCWDCKQCRAGRGNLCENLGFFGCGSPQGGMADFFTIAANRLHGVPDELDDRQAILIEPLSTPLHAVRLAGPLEGKSVAVLGAGTIGLLVLAIALNHGASRVVVTDLLESKRQRALGLGAHAVVDAGRPDAAEAAREVLGESADVVFDCVAIQHTVNQAVALALKGGTVVIVGIPSADVTIPLALIQGLEVRIQGSATYLPEDYREAIEILATGKVRPQDFITAVYPLDKVSEAFAAAASGEHVKVILTPADVPS